MTRFNLLLPGILALSLSSCAPFDALNPLKAETTTYTVVVDGTAYWVNNYSTHDNLMDRPVNSETWVVVNGKSYRCEENNGADCEKTVRRVLKEARAAKQTSTPPVTRPRLPTGDSD